MSPARPSAADVAHGMGTPPQRFEYESGRKQVNQERMTSTLMRAGLRSNSVFERDTARGGERSANVTVKERTPSAPCGRETSRHSPSTSTTCTERTPPQHLVHSLLPGRSATWLRHAKIDSRRPRGKTAAIGREVIEIGDQPRNSETHIPRGPRQDTLLGSPVPISFVDRRVSNRNNA